MTATILPNGKNQFFSSAGVPLVGGKLYTYATGTSTPKATYADAAAVTPNANPIILDARGEALIYWDGSYRVHLEDSLGNVIWNAIDDVTGNVLSQSTIGLYYRPRSAAEIAASVTPTNYFYDWGWPERYGAVAGTTAADYAVAVQTAITLSAAALGAPAYLTGTYYHTTNLTLPTNARIVSLGSELMFKTGTSGKHLDASSALNVRIVGHLTLNGQDTTNYLTGSPVAGNRTGLYATNYKDINVDRLTVHGYNNRGVLLDNQQYSDHATGASFGDVTAYENYCSFDMDTRAEANAIQGGQIRTSRIGIRQVGGNNSVSNTSICDNYHGIDIIGGAGLNDGHSIYNACQIDHSGNLALFCDSVENGATFIACNFYYGTIYIKDSNGISIRAGEIGNMDVYASGGTKPSFLSDNIINDTVVFFHATTPSGAGTQSYLIVRNNQAIAGTVSAEYNRSAYDIASTTLTALTADTTERTIVFTSPGIHYFGVTSGGATGTAYAVATGIGTVALPDRYNFTISVKLTNNAASITRVLLFVRVNGATVTSMYTQFDLAASVAGIQVPLVGTLQLNPGDTWDVRIQTASGANTVAVLNTTARLEVYGQTI